MGNMKKNKFIEGTLFAYIIILLTKIVGAIYVIPFRRIIGEDGGVLYSYAYSVYSLFLDISTSGIPTAISMIVAEYNSLKLFNEREYAFKISNKIVSIMAFAAFLVMFIFAEPFARFIISDISEEVSMPSIVLVIRVISFCLLIIPYLSAIRGYLQGNKYVSTSSTSQLVEQMVRIAIALIGSYVAINVWNLDVPAGVAVALSGTVIGGLVAYLVLRWKVHKNKKELMEGVTNPNDSTVSAKEITKKIFSRAIPVIIIAATQNIYNLVDLKLIIKGMHMIGYDAETSQLIGSIAVTWAAKICMIINSIAVSMSVSIIPFIVHGFVNNDKEELNSKFNQAISTILYTSIPLAAFMCLFKEEVYNVFYVPNEFGGNLLAALSILSIFFSVQMVMDMILQGMKNYKLVFTNTFIGLFLNAALDIPIILFLNRIGFNPYVGSIIASCIGLSTSIVIILIGSKKRYEFNYKNIFVNLAKILAYTMVMTGFVLLLKRFITISDNYLLMLFELGIIGTVAFGIYLLLSYKFGTMVSVLGEDFIGNIKKKFKK